MTTTSYMFILEAAQAASTPACGTEAGRAVTSPNTVDSLAERRMR